MIDTEVVLLILNCEKYREKANIQKTTWLKDLPSNISWYHVIGKASLVESKFDHENHLLYVATKDDYCSLPHKVIEAIRTVDNNFSYKYIFKTDDDQILTNPKFFNVVLTSLKLKSYDYGGKNVVVNDHFSTYHTIHNELPKQLFLKACKYCNGRFYFLSKRAIELVLSHYSYIAKQIIEDHTIGSIIQDFGKNLVMTNIETDNYLLDIDKFYHIFTECVNCPELAYNAIKSFLHYHKHLVLNVYLTEVDLDYFKKSKKELLDHKQVQFILMDKGMIETYHQSGHLGTAIIWTNVINQFRATRTRCIHFDSDVIFTGDMVNNILIDLYNNDLVGPLRSYKNNHNGRDDIRYLSDVCSTYCFGFNPAKISNKYDYDTMVNMVRGFYNPLGHPILDFFDPVSFDIIKNGGTISYIDYNLIGCMDLSGSKMNKHGKINSLFDVGDKVIHFSAIGSGINYLKLKEKGLKTNVPMSYIEAGLRSYNIYNHLVYDKELDPNALPNEDQLKSLMNFKPYFIKKIKPIGI